MKTAVRYSVKEVIQQVEENEDDGNRTWSSIDSDVHVKSIHQSCRAHNHYPR